MSRYISLREANRLKEEIIEELDRHDSDFELETGEIIQAIWFYDFDKVADGLVKLFDIHNAVSHFSDEKLAEIADNQVQISNGCFGELGFTQGKREGFEDGLLYFRDVILNRIKQNE